jgi:hypothetical protein
MSTLSRTKALFNTPATVDKLTLFESLFNAKELNVPLTLSLLKIIHRELVDHQTPDRTLYKRYAEMIAALRYHKADMLQQVVDAWRTENPAKEVEWLADGVIK